MKLLITGGAGFIGSNFINYWLKKHLADYIINFDKLTYAGNLDNLRAVEKSDHYRFIQGDICEQSEELAKSVEWCDIIVHFAAESHVDRSIDGADEFIRTNVVGTHNLLNLAKEFNKHFHHISTDEVFGSLALDSKNKFNEKTAYNPRNPYSASKAASDHLVRSFYKTHGLPITITNCSNNFGPNQNLEKLIPKAITNLLQGKKVPVYGDGLNVRDWLYVKDHCRAIELVIKKGRIGETYCIGGMHEEVSNLELVKTILDIMGLDDEMIEFVPDRPGHDRKYAVDWSKARNELGWQPETNWRERLRDTVKWYYENQWYWQAKLKMKGIILAGGFGTRLRPMTKVTNKHLLPVYDKPMIYYPIETLVSAGITDIMIITGSESAGDFMTLLGSGQEFGAKFTYRLQEGAGGIAEALGLCREFAGDDPMAVVLGDNIFADSITEAVKNFNGQGATVFLKEVEDPKRYGVATIEGDKITKIVEKPDQPESNLAVTGLYLYDSQVWDMIGDLKPSARGELEITDVNNWYVKKDQMKFHKLNGFWSDAGTIESLFKVSAYMEAHNHKTKTENGKQD